MKMALAYAPRPGPLGRSRPWIAAVYLAPLAVAAFACANPVVLVAAGIGAYAAGALSGAAASVRRPLRWALAIAVFVIAVNGIASQRGATILFRFGEVPVLGNIDVTAEALAEGAVLALRIVVAILVFAVWSACVDPDRILRALRPIAARSALTATLVSRMVPLAAADAARLGEAAALRGPAAAPVKGPTLARRLIAGSLDRSVDIAATLELRGYGLGTRHRMPRHEREPGEAAVLACGLLSLILLVAGLGAGLGGFDAYPTVDVDVGPGTLALAAALPILAVLPFALDGRRRRS
jgi:energy-coupling factor transport system permease protein